MKGGELMNAIAMMQSQSSNLPLGTQSKNNQMNQTQSAFDTVLGKLANGKQSSNEEAQLMVTSESLAEVLHLIHTNGQELEGLNLEQLAQIVNELGTELSDENQNLLNQIKQFIEDGSFTLSTGKENDLIDSLTPHSMPFNMVTIQQSSQPLTDAKVMDQFTHLFSEVKGLLAQGPNEQQLAQIAPKILELLEKWTMLETKYKHVMEHVQGLLEASPREGQLWKELLQTFQKRHQFALNQQYNSNAKVTSKDIANWLTRALSADVRVEQPTIKATEHVSGMPMSKIEQYVIHIQQGQSAQAADKQLMDQFQNMIKSSRFLTMNNGLKQLSITLRPENLGEMMVRLTEVNGEMMVKILVSSQATRQMLETNIHQLKNMFAPHQVVIEESNDLHVQNTSEEFEEQEQAFDDQDGQEHSEQSNKDKSKESDLSFHDVLMNEKV